MVIETDIDNWKSRDFVKFFYRCYEEYYGERPPIVYDRDCAIMKRVIDNFRKVDRSEVVVLKFIKWAFKNYVADKKFIAPIKIGFLQYMMDKFLGFPVKERIQKERKKKKKKESYSPETMKFLTEQRKLYRERLKKGKKYDVN